MASIASLREQVNKLKGEAAFGQRLPAGCRTPQQWNARLAKHRAKPVEDHGPLFPAGGEEPFKWALELSNARIAEKLAELRLRDWTQRKPSEAPVDAAPTINERTVTRRQQAPTPDRLADYRDKRETLEEPQAYPDGV